MTDGILGSIHAFRGDLAAARPLLDSCQRIARRLDVLSMQVDSAAALAWVAAPWTGTPSGARSHCRFVLERWGQQRGQPLRGLGAAARRLDPRPQGDSAGAHGCAEALAAIASESGHGDALAALAHALGETALLAGEPSVAAGAFRSRARPPRDARDPVRDAPRSSFAPASPCRSRASAKPRPRAARRGLPRRPQAGLAPTRLGRRGRGGRARRVGREAARASAPPPRPRAAGSPGASSRYSASPPTARPIARSPAAST